MSKKENIYKFNAGYYEWHLLQNGKIIKVYDDFVEALPLKCTKENLRYFIEGYLLDTEDFINEDYFENKEDYNMAVRFNKAVKSEDKEKIIQVILGRIYYEYGDI